MKKNQREALKKKRMKVSHKNKFGKMLRPFGPCIAKIIIPKDIIKKLNVYVDLVIKDKEKSKKLDHGKKLAGNVQQEFKLEEDIIKTSGWGDFLTQGAASWIYNSSGKKVTKFTIIDSWIVRQFKNEYNPIHWHSGHVSGVAYLKVPENFGDSVKKENRNGRIGVSYLIYNEILVA